MSDKRQRHYIVGNWKMNGMVADLAQIEAIDNAAKVHGAVDVALCPPSTLIARAKAKAMHIRIGAQDCHAKPSGAHTGCLSAAMLAEAGASFAIVGHSERRADQHETDDAVRGKSEALLAQGMGAILCVGEALETRDSGQAVPFVLEQLHGSLPDNSDGLTIAYEPVWAIGTGRIPELSDIAEMHQALHGALVRRFGDAGAAIRILYGGSVNGDNAVDILAIDHVGGALVGGASLTAAKFEPIIAAAR